MFFTAFDSKYFPWGSILLDRLSILHPDTPVIVVAVDLTPSEILELRDRTNTRIEKRSVAETGSGRGVTIANRRPFWLLEAAKKYSPDWLLFLDADLYIRSSLTELFNEHRNSDAAVVIRDGILHGKVLHRLRVAAGFALFNRTGFALINDWCAEMNRSRAIEDVRPFAWFWEQTCLFSAVNSTNLCVSYINREKYLSAYPFANEATVWSANEKEPIKSEILIRFQLENAENR